MTIKPAKNNFARRCSFIMLLSGIMLFALSSFLSTGKAAVQICSLAIVVAGIEILVRYWLSDFRYILDIGDETADFIVMRSKNKQEIKVCHIAAGKITYFGKRSSFNNSTDKPKTSKRFNYCQNLKSEQYIIIYSDGDSSIEILFEPDEAFAAKLSALIAQSRQNGSGMGFSM